MSDDDDDTEETELDPLRLAGQVQAHQSLLAYLLAEMAARFDDPTSFLHDFKSQVLPEPDPDDPVSEYAAQEMEVIADLAERSFE